MNTNIFLEISNGTAVPQEKLTAVDFNSFRSAIAGAIDSGCRVLDLFAEKEDGDSKCHRLICILGDPRLKQIKIASTVVGSQYDALSAKWSASAFLSAT